MKHILLLAGLVAALCGRLYAQSELITNGGFESGLSGWAVTSGANATITSNSNFVHSGVSALTITTINGTEQVSQPFTLPSNTAVATLSYWYTIFSSDGLNVANASLTVYIANAAGVPVGLPVDTKLNTDRDQRSGIYHEVTFDLSPYTNTTSGQLQVQFVVTAVSNGGTLFYIDDVSAQSITSAGLPLNDNFANASVLVGSSISVTSSNVFATKEPGEPNHAGNPGGHSLWWRWTPPSSGVVTITTDGSNFDTLLAAYTGIVVSNLTRVAFNNDDNNGLSVTSLIRFPVNAGTLYDIAVDGADGATGIIVMTLNFVPDTKGPTVSFISPRAGASVTNSTVTVTGKASDNVAVALVQYRLENAAGTNDYQNATGTNQWTAVVTNLVPGVNTVRVQAYDSSTNVTTVARSFYYDIFGPAEGTYAGLFLDTNSVTVTNAGFFSAKVAAKGKFTAKLLLGGRTYPFSGQFGFDSTFSNSIAGSGRQPLVVQLLVDLSGGDIMTGSISNSAWAVPLMANRDVFSRTHPAPQGPNKYTVVIQAGDDPATQPGGFGFGTAKLDALGNVSFSGTLGDAAKASQRTFISKAGAWPFFVSPYAGQGVMLGWLTFADTPESDFSGTVNWLKLPQKAKLYPNGFNFTNGVGVVGSLYHFTNGVPLLALTNGGGVIALQGGNLSGPVSYGFSLDNRNHITGTNKLSLSFATATGLFHGTVPNPDTGKSIAVSGALLEKQNAGFGLFSGTNQTGRVDLGN